MDSGIEGMCRILRTKDPSKYYTVVEISREMGVNKSCATRIALKNNKIHVESFIDKTGRRVVKLKEV